MPRSIAEIPTPALVVDYDVMMCNIAAMSAVLPGARLRPHVKAHKCTQIARRQQDAGHRGFTCATIREVEGMAAAGLGEDLLLANEILDARRIGAVLASGARVTVAVDSLQTIDAAIGGGVREVVIDVNVGLRRCGCAPADAASLAEHARGRGLRVRGVMGYEGHLMMTMPDDRKRKAVEESMRALLDVHQNVGGELVTGGGTGTYLANRWVTEIQAGSYVLMDSQYGELDTPFAQAFWVLGTVISSNDSWQVADAGLKAMSLDHGNPAINGADVSFVSDEHITLVAGGHAPMVGDRIRITPSHVDPTIALHERMYVVRDDEVIDEWPVDLRGW
ncbi:alanine racemase [Cumulibacter soli]|uniref:alanine racemase n=1 Tax=Cumulibacter soli TaxID=2546344 RepID=UPI00106747B4|nr:alanine racemase [Cumulibacter soli]